MFRNYYEEKMFFLINIIYFFRLDSLAVLHIKIKVGILSIPVHGLRERINSLNNWSGNEIFILPIKLDDLRKCEKYPNKSIMERSSRKVGVNCLPVLCSFTASRKIKMKDMRTVVLSRWCSNAARLYVCGFNFRFLAKHAYTYRFHFTS